MNLLKILIVGFICLAAAICVIKLPNHIRSRKAMKKVTLETKNMLLSGGDYCPIDKSVIRLVRISVIKSHLIGFAITMLVFIISVVTYFMADDDKITIMLFGAVFPFFMIIKTAFELLKLSDSSKLIKVKGFIFITRTSEIRVMYYDRKKLKFCYFTQGTLFDKEDILQGGRVINLIARRGKFRIHIIKALTF